MSDSPAPGTGAPGTEAPIAGDFIINDSVDLKDGFKIGRSPKIQINNLDRMARLKLELRGSKLYGFANYDQSHNKNERAATKITYDMTELNFKTATADSPATFDVINDTDVVIDVGSPSLSAGNSVYFELTRGRKLGTSPPEGSPSPQDVGTQAPTESGNKVLAVYQDTAGKTDFTILYIVLGVFAFVFLVLVYFVRRNNSRKEEDKNEK